MGLSENSRLFQIWRWGPNSYLIKLMVALDWVLSQIKMADRGVGLQRVNSVMIKVVGDWVNGGAFQGAIMWSVQMKKKKLFSHDINQMTQPSRCNVHLNKKTMAANGLLMTPSDG